MSIVFLNGDYLPQQEAKVSVLDRGFLFGDGIYEVIPVYSGKLLRCDEHLARLERSLSAINIQLHWSRAEWRQVFTELLTRNPGQEQMIYLQVTRGADCKRAHAFPENIAPTVFAMVAPMPALHPVSGEVVKPASAITLNDLRWKRCDIKSTSLLGNLLHYQAAVDAGVNEVILFNDRGEVTECSSSNVFVVKDGVISTPVKDQAILPGITRDLVLELASREPRIEAVERTIDKEELLTADEIWITSSTKEILPVTELDGQPVADGQIGPLWQELMARYQAYKQS